MDCIREGRSFRKKRGVLFHVACLILLALAAASGGCMTVGPDYRAPDTKVSPSWHTELKGGLTADDKGSTDLVTWWKTLNDTKLTDLIERAVAGNLDMKKAKSRVREARARRGVARAAFFPSIDASGSAIRSQSSENTGGTTGGSPYRNFYSTGFDASWEIDVFGGIRRSVEAADADVSALEENLNDVLVSLLAEVALNYVDVRTYQARLAAAEGNAYAQNETLQLILWRSQAGLSDELAVEEARYNLESTRSQIPPLRTGLEEAMNRIAVLLGEQPGAVHASLKEPESIPLIPRTVAVGVPADMVRRRPDIRKAERELAAQTARVGVAVADLYPKFTLIGSIGLESISTGDLLSRGSRALSGGPTISLPIFQGGALRQKIEIQSALQEQAAINYEATLLTALEEVENVLTAYSEEQLRRDALVAAADGARKAALLAEGKYEAGLTNFIIVLDAQRSLRNFENQLAESSGTVTSNLIRLYKALGGGWQSLEPAPKAELAKGEKR